MTDKLKKQLELAYISSNQGSCTSNDSVPDPISWEGVKELMAEPPIKSLFNDYDIFMSQETVDDLAISEHTNHLGGIVINISKHVEYGKYRAVKKFKITDIKLSFPSLLEPIGMELNPKDYYERLSKEGEG
jgi:hypothetical protein